MVGGRTFRIDPADWSNPGARTAKVRLIGWVVTANVAPAVTYTFNLQSVASYQASSGIILTLNAATNSTPSITSPAANTATRVVGAEFTVPTLNVWTVTLTVSAATAANAFINCRAQLQTRQV
jgi:hypothetical protein